MNEYQYPLWALHDALPNREVFCEYRHMSQMMSSWMEGADMHCRLDRFPDRSYIGGGTKRLKTVLPETLQVLHAWERMSFSETLHQESYGYIHSDFSRSEIQHVESLLEDGLFCVNDTSQVFLFQDVFLLPAKSAFLQSHLSRDTSLHLGKYMTSVGCSKTDVIVMDPPWPSKAVARRSMYKTLPLDILLADLSSLGNLLLWNGLVVVWVTNNPAITEFVLSQLFPAIGVVPIEQWAWVKLTSHYEPVIPWNNRQRKPYERILVGIKNDCDYAFDSSKINRFLFSEVPIDLHSLKPCLDLFIDKLVPVKLVKPKFRIELFARNVKPGYFAWGNQALLLQHFSFWKPTMNANRI